jgi:predicted metal-binding protein
MAKHSILDEATPEGSSPKWQAVYLICKQCGDRKNGPKRLKPKELVSSIRSHVRDERPRPRILLSSCLGMCPKKSVAIAFVGSGQPPRWLAVRKAEQLEVLLPLLRNPHETPSSL